MLFRIIILVLSGEFLITTFSVFLALEASNPQWNIRPVPSFRAALLDKLLFFHGIIILVTLCVLSITGIIYGITGESPW